MEITLDVLDDAPAIIKDMRTGRDYKADPTRISAGDALFLLRRKSDAGGMEVLERAVRALSRCLQVYQPEMDEDATADAFRPADIFKVIFAFLAQGGQARSSSAPPPTTKKKPQRSRQAAQR